MTQPAEILPNDINGLADYDLKNAEYEIGDEIQSDIDNDIYFKHNSVNLVIGKRGSGKTYMVMREVLKVAYLMEWWDRVGREDDPRYTQIYYITDKLRDDTCERAKYYIEKNTRMQFIWESTENALEIINGITTLKALLSDPDAERFKNKVEEDPTLIEDARRYLNINPNDTSGILPHTLIIFDDCIGLFNKYSPLSKKLFENRQSRITYFLILQDVQGLNPSMKANVDSLVFFGGFPKHKWNSLMYQMPVIHDGYSFDNYYSKLRSHDFVLFDYIDNLIYEKERNTPFTLIFQP